MNGRHLLSGLNRAAQALAFAAAFLVPFPGAAATGAPAGPACPVPPAGTPTKEGYSMSITAAGKTARPIPPIDASAPKVTETAVFGLG